jgi:hypothetical protein
MIWLSSVPGVPSVGQTLHSIESKISEFLFDRFVSK